MPETETIAPPPEASPPSETFGDSAPETGAPTPDSNGTQTNGAKPLSAAGKDQQAKRESRYERTKRQRAELQKRESALKEREERIAQAERSEERRVGKEC